MTREEAISKWVIPAVKDTWNKNKCKEIIEALEPKTGHWILDADREHGRCSECGCKEDLVDGHSSYKWCSNCGAKMEV